MTTSTPLPAADGSTQATPHGTRRRLLARRTARRLRQAARRAAWGVRLVASAVAVVGVLSVLAAVPVANVYVLGYLLAAEGRVGRGERWRDVLPWVRFAPRVAAVAFGTAVTLIPTAVLADFARDAALVDPAGPAAVSLRRWTAFVGAVSAAHLFLAYARGGPLSSYFRPIKNVRLALAAVRRRAFVVEVGDRFWSAVSAFRPGALTRLGALGLAVATLWLLVPCGLIAAAGPADGARLVLKLAGLLSLTLAFPLLLVLQAHFAADERLRSGLAVRSAVRLFGRAPLAWLAAGTLTATLALPLFLFKIVAPPRDALWLLTPLFVAAMLPARVATGWAYGRAARRDRRRGLVPIGLAVAGLFAVGLAYSTGVFLSQYVNEHGRKAVFEQHAFALPVPF